MEEISIGEFARRSRLSVKALRLYDKRRVLVPARVDEDSGYRYYDVAQLEDARLVSMLRQLDLSLAAIRKLVACDPVDAGNQIAAHWRKVRPRRTPRARRLPRQPTDWKEAHRVRSRHTRDARAERALLEAQRRREGRVGAR